jgi:hypothetical protein
MIAREIERFSENRKSKDGAKSQVSQKGHLIFFFSDDTDR